MVTRPHFVGFGRPAIALRGTGWGSPPEFTSSSTHTAQVVLLNPTDRTWAYRGEVYLDGRIASSGIVEFTIEAGAERPIDFPVVMPEEARSYEAFLDVSVGEDLILHYPFQEPVTIRTVYYPVVTATDVVFKGAVTLTSGVPGVPPGDYPVFEFEWRNTEELGLVNLLVVLPDLPSTYCFEGFGCFRSFGGATIYGPIPPGTRKHLVVLAVLPAVGLRPGTVTVKAVAYGAATPLSGVTKEIGISNWHSPNIGAYGAEILRDGIEA